MKKVAVGAIGVLLLGAVGASGGARADVLVLPASKDATLYGGTGTGNSASGPGLFIGGDGNSAPKRGLIAFDVSAIPSSATITSATFTMYLGQVAGAGGGTGTGDSTARTIRLFDMQKSWNGSTNGTTATTFNGANGSAAHTGDVTWLFSTFNSTAWANAGGDFSPTEVADASITQDVSDATHGPFPYTWNSSALTANVQSWVSGGINFGWELVNDSETTKQTFRAFYTKEGAASFNLPSLAPTLTVTFTTAPEPGGGVIVGAAALMLRSRRRGGNLCRATTA